MRPVNNGNNTKEDKDETTMYDRISKTKDFHEESPVRIKREEEEDVVEITVEDILGYSDEEALELPQQRSNNSNTKTDERICHINLNVKEIESSVPLEEEGVFQAETSEQQLSIESAATPTNNLTSNISIAGEKLISNEEKNEDSSAKNVVNTDTTARAHNVFTLRELLSKPTLLQTALNLCKRRQFREDLTDKVPFENVPKIIKKSPEKSKSDRGKKLPPLIPMKSSEKLKRTSKGNKNSSDSDFDSDFEEKSSLKKLKFDQTFLIDKLLNPDEQTEKDNTKVINEKDEDIFIISDSEDEQISTQNNSNKHCDTQKSTIKESNTCLNDNQQVVVRYVTENNQEQVIIENKSEFEVVVELNNLDKDSNKTTDVDSTNNTTVNSRISVEELGSDMETNIDLSSMEKSVGKITENIEYVKKDKNIWIRQDVVENESNTKKRVRNKKVQKESTNNDSDNDNLTISEDPLEEPKKKKKVVITKKLLKELQESAPKKKSYDCIIPECLYSAKSKAAIWSHLRDGHQFMDETNCETYKCLDTVCPEKFDSRKTLMLHLIEYHGKNSNGTSCVICTFKASTPSSLANHFKLHGVLLEQTQLVRCPLCRYVIKNCAYKHLVYHNKNMDESNEEARKLSEIDIKKQIEEVLLVHIKKQQTFVSKIVEIKPNSTKKKPEKKSRILKRYSSDDFETPNIWLNDLHKDRNVIKENSKELGTKTIRGTDKNNFRKRSSTEDFEMPDDFSKVNSNEEKRISEEKLSENSQKIETKHREFLKRSSTEDFDKFNVKKKVAEEINNKDLAKKFLDNFPKLSEISITLVETSKKF